MFTMGSTIEGISPLNPNLFAHRPSHPSTLGIKVAEHLPDSRPSRPSTTGTKVAEHLPDSSVSVEIEVSENQVSENRIEEETPCTEPSSLPVTETPKED